MTYTIAVHRLRAFVNENGEYGNPTGIIIDLEKTLSQPNRQKIATQLHFTDTVFVNMFEPVNLSFHNPQEETKFAGDALISTSYFLRHVLSRNVEVMVCKGGAIRTWEESGITWIEASLTGTPPWQHKQLATVQEVDAITDEDAARFEHTLVWAWNDEKKGKVRSRTFLPDWGTLEDQGNGSGSMQLAAHIGKPLEVWQGKGSLIFAAPAKSGFAQVGGRVIVDETQTITI